MGKTARGFFGENLSDYMLLRSDAERIEEDGIMEKQIKIKADTLFLPICAGKKTELMECFCEGKKVMELQVPVDIQEP